jgi:quinolinate synthase
MAQMVTAQQIIDARELYPDAAVVAYVNTTAEVKAESDICCTSANAVEVVAAVPSSQIIMVPDENLGRYVARHTSKEIIPWNGFCYVHDRFLVEEAISAKSAHPSAELLVHPECRPEVIDLADKVLSTSGMSRHAKTSRSKEFIIGTEVGMLYRLEKENPDKRFYPLSKKAVCQNMKKTNLAKVERALESLKTQVEVSSDVSERARLSIQRMLDLKM